jgi:hypothetical protein
LSISAANAAGTGFRARAGTAAGAAAAGFWAMPVSLPAKAADAASAIAAASRTPW